MHQIEFYPEAGRCSYQNEIINLFGVGLSLGVGAVTFEIQSFSQQNI